MDVALYIYLANGIIFSQGFREFTGAKTLSIKSVRLLRYFKVGCKRLSEQATPAAPQIMMPPH